MNSDKTTPRLLGAAFLIVIVASALSGALLQAVVGAGSISDLLVHIPDHLTLLRLSIVVELGESLGIVVLAVLLYRVLNQQNQTIALVALGWWLAEAITLAVSKLGALALIPLSRAFVEAGAPDHSSFQVLGDFLYYGVDRRGYDLHMFFYCVGGILWFFLFYRSKAIPWILAVWGMVAESVALIGSVLVFFDVRDILFFIHILVLELVIGLWLVVKGIRDSSEVTRGSGKIKS